MICPSLKEFFEIITWANGKYGVGKISANRRTPRPSAIPENLGKVQNKPLFFTGVFVFRLF